VTNSDGSQRSREVTGARLDRDCPDLAQQVRVKKLSTNAAALILAEAVGWRTMQTKSPRTA
jgi:hypothetical protein